MNLTPVIDHKIRSINYLYSLIIVQLSPVYHKTVPLNLIFAYRSPSIQNINTLDFSPSLYLIQNPRDKSESPKEQTERLKKSGIEKINY